MKKCIVLLLLLSSVFHMTSCKDNTGEIAESIQNEIVEFVKTNDFSGYFWVGDKVADTIETCLSATLFDIDTIHYMTLIISRYPGDAFIGTPYYHLNQKSPMYYRVGNKDLFVYSHTNESENPLFPQCEYSEKAVLEKENAYFIKENIDDRFVIQTYKYRLVDRNVLIERDSTFNLFRWLYQK